MKHKTISIDGKVSDSIEISDKIFSLEPNKAVIQNIIYC